MYEFAVTSHSIQEGAMVPERFVFNNNGCLGANISPELEWRGAPSETKSFALTCHDPDASTKGNWLHWTVINIPNNVSRIEENASQLKLLPHGAQELMSDYKKSGYGGPCPPKGDGPHRYVFTVYALGVDRLDVESSASGEDILNLLEESALSKTTLTAKYLRS